MKKIFKQIKVLEYNKYRNSAIKLNDIKKRVQLQKRIFTYQHQSNLNCQKYCNICKKFQIYLSEKNFIKFYKKFNVHLKIHKYYDKSLRPIKSKKGETCLINYIKLSLATYKYKHLDKAQKLNTILKLNDKILITVIKKKKINFTQQIKDSFKNEQILIKGFLND
jgi:hypothetical protein